MANYTVEQIEYLREKAYLTYEEALEVLERFNGDLTRCLVDLERRGRIRPAPRSGAPRPKTRAQKPEPDFGRSSAKREAPKGRDADWHGIFSTFLHTNFIVTKDGGTIANLPALFVLLVFLFAPHVMIPSILLMFVLGCRVNLKTARKDGSVEEEIRNIVDNAAENIRKTADSFAEAAKSTAETVRNSAKQAPEETANTYETPAAEDAPYGEVVQEFDVRPAQEAPKAETPAEDAAPHAGEPIEKSPEDGEENEITIG